MVEKNKLSIEVDADDHVFVETACSQGGFTFYTFFKHLLEIYRKSLNELPLASEIKTKPPIAPILVEEEEVAEEVVEIEEPVRERKKYKTKKFRES